MINFSFARPIVFIDIESTGINPQFDRIIEIGMIKISPNGNEESLNFLINPMIPIPSDSSEIHGIKDSDVAGKPSFEESAKEIFSFIDNCDVGGFAIKRFDLPLLEAEFQRAGITYSRQGKKIIDVLTIYHEFEPRDLKAAYKKYCDMDLEIAHRAGTDIRATIDIFKAQLNKHGDLPKDIDGLHEFCNPRNPNWIDSEGKFTWVGDVAVINFGKNQGKSLEYLAKNDVSFLNWIIGKDFSLEVKKMVADALEGQLPKKSK